MQLAASIFKAYDIRGIVPSTVDEAVAEGIGRAFGTIARAEGETTVAVGRDGRLSGPALSAALMRGLVAVGLQVIDVGRVTTPMLYFAASTLCGSGIQVTGSHNPKDYNGFKMVMRGRAIYGDEIQAIHAMMVNESWVLRDGGSVRTVDVLAAYSARIVGDIKLARPMKIVVDSGNGIAGASAPAILRAIGCEVIELFSEVDGNFPNHHPDPSKPENLRDLIPALRETGAELGLAFDGDGDRLGIVTRDGNNIYPDRQMMLFAQDVLSRVPGGTILFDVKCSQRLAPAIEAAGGVALMYKTGHSLIKAKMKAIEAEGKAAPLGGEMSGHIFFKERWYGFDDGTYAGCRLLEIVSRSPGRQRRAGRPAHELFHARTQRAMRRRRAAPRDGRLAEGRGQPRWRQRPPPRGATRRWRTSTPLTACAWTGPMALAWCAALTPRRCWCCVLKATPRRRCTASRPTCWPCCAASSPTRRSKPLRTERPGREPRPYHGSRAVFPADVAGPAIVAPQAGAPGRGRAGLRRGGGRALRALPRACR
jgi:phosphomannomutase